MDIIRFAVSSQEEYLSLMLVSRRFRNLVRFECLPNVPIVITSQKQAMSFLDLIKAEPNISVLIRYMWIVVDYSGESQFKLIRPIINSCTNITHLACRAVFMLVLTLSKLCDWPMSCKELTLMDGGLTAFKYFQQHSDN
jgi:hypothetical protein